MYMMASWYTDLMDIYRVTNTVTDGITTQDLSLIASGVPCRVYSNQTNNWNGRATEATIRADEKLPSLHQAFRVGFIPIRPTTGTEERQRQRSGQMKSCPATSIRMCGKVTPCM